MDLREKKTRASIRRAYLELRAEKGAGRITVRELADRAQVGKATFYLHYRSIYDLSEPQHLRSLRGPSARDDRDDRGGYR